MSQRLSNAETDDVNCHHEAGHACMMVMCGVPIVLFERMPGGDARIVPDRSSRATDSKGLYGRFLATRASRHSQKLSPFNSTAPERGAFKGDYEEIDLQAKGLFDMMQATWGKNRPSRKTFRAELLKVADAELTDLYNDEGYRTLVRRVAAEFMKVQSMNGVDVERLVRDLSAELGLAPELTHYDEFAAVLSPLPSGAADGE